MEAREFLHRIRNQKWFQDQVVHVEELPAREARCAEVSGGLQPAVESVLKQQGITQLYTHQAETIGHVREGRDVVVVTGTASGKTLCYNIPVVEALLEKPAATMLYLFPTKALAQDQLRAIARFQGVGGEPGEVPPDIKAQSASGAKFLAGVYDGDTPTNLRRKVRDGGNILLTNPDMLHQGILPQHARWNRVFTNLRYIVIDEIHAYRGVFGSHLANVLRRVARVCAHYGSQPQFICCSATIGNPKDHAERVTAREMALVDQDGSPRGSRQFVFWNPPPIEGMAAGGDDHDWRVGGNRRSPIWEATHLMAALVREKVQTIAFVRTRLAAELLFKNCRDSLRPVSRKLADSIHAYRGGYLPEERRAIERRLVERDILGVSSTSALELGIDIGSLDACILVGYPGSIASLWQRSGRAGRGHDESLVFLVGMNAPMDQYLMLHSDYVFAQNPEQAVVDPDNPHVVVGHLKCASHELPLDDSEVAFFGEFAPVVLELLEEEGSCRHLRGRWYWSQNDYPSASVNLRNMGGPVYTIQEDAEQERVIGTMDESTALSQLFTHAVYLHGAETYFVNRLDLEQKIAFVEKRDLDYYTQSIQTSDIRVDEIDEETLWPVPPEGPTPPPDGSEDPEAPACAGFGDVTVTTSIPMFKKIKFHSRDSLGFEQLELPPQILETVAMWLCTPRALEQDFQAREILIGEALIGLANLFVEIAPCYVMCDPQDIGTVVDASCFKRPTLFVHDRYPGGLGYARRCLDSLGEILRTCRDVVKECACDDGCPSCVGSPIPPFAMTDLDSATRGRIPNKEGAVHLLDALLS